MACNLSTIQAAACESGIGKLDSRIKLLQAIAQLSCELAEAAAPAQTGGLIWGPAPETVDSILNDSDSFLNDLGSLFPTSAYTELDFGNPVTVTNSIDSANSVALTSIQFRLLESVGGYVDISAAAALTSVSFPSLQTITGSAGIGLDLSNDPVLTSISFPVLTSIGEVLNLSGTAIINATFPLLTTVTNQINISGGVMEVLSLPVLSAYPVTGIVADASLLTLNIPACVDDGAGQLNTDLALMTGLVTLNIASMVTITANLTLSGSPSLASFTASAWVPTDGTTIDFNGCSLDIPSVELILRRCVLAGVATCTIDLSGGTNAGTASLSAQGQADVATLGAQVTMNP